MTGSERANTGQAISGLRQGLGSKTHGYVAARRCRVLSHMWGIVGISPCMLSCTLSRRGFSCELRPTPRGYAKPYSCESMSNTGDTLQQRVRCAMSLRYVMFVLALLISADAHIATAFAGNQAIVEPTCGARLPTLKRDASPSVIHNSEPRPSTVSHSPSPLLHEPVLALSTLEKWFFPNGNWHQDQLHAFVHVFLF